jgi:hypothetical protein
MGKSVNSIAFQFLAATWRSPDFVLFRLEVTQQ